MNFLTKGGISIVKGDWSCAKQMDLLDFNVLAKNEQAEILGKLDFTGTLVDTSTENGLRLVL